MQYLVDIAREVKPLADNEKIEDNKIRVVPQPMGSSNKNADGIMTYKHDGDAFITKVTAKIIIDIVNEKVQKK